MTPILTTQKRQKKLKSVTSQYRRLVKRPPKELNFKSEKHLPGEKGQMNCIIFVRAEEPEVETKDACEKSTKMLMKY